MGQSEEHPLLKFDVGELGRPRGLPVFDRDAIAAVQCFKAVFHRI